MTADHPAKRRIAKANQVQSMRILSVTEQIEALGRCIAELEARTGGTRRPVHPHTGCWCQSCTERDDWLESKAEARAEARAWASDGDADRAADRYYGGAR